MKIFKVGNSSLETSADKPTKKGQPRIPPAGYNPVSEKENCTRHVSFLV